ncbi:ionic transporter y4hA, partial [Acinetobacter baumannii]
TAVLARDTVFAATMLIFNGITGACLLIGGIKYKEQFFSSDSTNVALTSLVAIIILTLVLPNFTTSANGPVYSEPQLIFVAIVCLIIYAT